jgi:hypothetical protein
MSDPFKDPLDPKLNPSFNSTGGNFSVRPVAAAPQPGGIHKGFLLSFILMVALGSFIFG